MDKAEFASNLLPTGYALFPVLPREWKGSPLGGQAGDNLLYCVRSGPMLISGRSPAATADYNFADETDSVFDGKIVREGIFKSYCYEEGKVASLETVWAKLKREE